MNHNEIDAPMLSAFLDGELGENERAALLAHLETCEACRAELAALAAVHEALADETDYPAPEGFADGVMARVRAEGARRSSPRVWKRWAGLAACAAVIVLAASVLPNALRPKETAASQALTAAPAAANDAETAYDALPEEMLESSLFAEPAEMPAAAPEPLTDPEALKAVDVPVPEADAASEPPAAGITLEPAPTVPAAPAPGTQMTSGTPSVPAGTENTDKSADVKSEAELFTVRLYGDTEELTDFLLAHGAQQKTEDVFVMDGDLLRDALEVLPEDATLDEEDAETLDKLSDDMLAMLVIWPEATR